MSRRRIAVVVPTRDRPELLARCLAALLAQTRPADEVIVVDDGSRVPASEGMPRIPGAEGLHVIRHDTPRGPAVARNRGWRACSADLVAFTDDDCRADPGWLAALEAAADSETVVIGRTVPDPLDGGVERAVTDRTIRIESFNALFLTCNALYPRPLLERLSGFDERFPLPYGEDSDLGQRAMRGGAPGSYAPEATVFHAIHHLGVLALLRERRRMTELARLVRLHPQLRRTAWAGLFVKREHRVLLEALAGILLLPWTPAGLAPAERYLHECRVRVAGMRPERHRQDLAGLMAIDAFEVAVCVAGSLRHRTILL